MLQFMRSQRLGHLRNGNSKKELKILEVKKTITDMKNEYIESENYPKQSIDSMQSPSRYQQYFSQN